MPTEIEKRAFVVSALRPLADHTLPFLTQVIGVIDETQGEFRGTGFFCTVHGRQAIVTAAHVIEEAARSGKFQSLAFSRGHGAPPTIVAGKILSSAPLDLAVYLPSRPFPLGEDKAFWPEERIDRSPVLRGRDYLFVHGFPARFSRFTTHLGNALISESLAYGAMMSYRQCDIPHAERAEFQRDLPDYPFLPDDALASHQFALNFFVEPNSFREPEERGRAPRESVVRDWSEVFQPGHADTLPGQKTRGAYGLSGSPVWRIGAARRKIGDWEPGWSQLVGIITHWNAERNILIATEASRIFDIVRDDEGMDQDR